MRLIFLDFDGVMNTPSIWSFEKEKAIGKKHVDALQKIMSNCVDVGVVISSTWRHFYSLKEIGRFLAHHGFTHADKIIGKTPDFSIHPRRGLEIAAYLKDLKQRPDDYIILDDNTDMTQEQIDGGHFFSISCIVGLTEDLADKIIFRFKEGG